MANTEITLKVAEAISQKDVGQGVARLDPNVMDDLDIHERDLIEIVGEKRTAAIALPSQTDIGLGVIRIDGLVRKNSGATIGGEVTIKSTDLSAIASSFCEAQFKIFTNALFIVSSLDGT